MSEDCPPPLEDCSQLLQSRKNQYFLNDDLYKESSVTTSNNKKPRKHKKSKNAFSSGFLLNKNKRKSKTSKKKNKRKSEKLEVKTKQNSLIIPEAQTKLNDTPGLI